VKEREGGVGKNFLSLLSLLFLEGVVSPATRFS